MVIARNETIIAVVLVGMLALSACGSRSHTAVISGSGSAAEGQASTASVDGTAAPREPDDILLTEEDITDRPYEVLGDIVATVSKNTIFDSDPTRDNVDETLREQAAEMGADAVVLVRYGSVGVGLSSWGELEGKGRAVVFTD